MTPRVNLPGVAEGMGAEQGVRGGYGGWIDGRAHEDTTWASDRGEMELDNLGHGGRTAVVRHCLTVQGRPTELPD